MSTGSQTHDQEPVEEIQDDQTILAEGLSKGLSKMRPYWALIGVVFVVVVVGSLITYMVQQSAQRKNTNAWESYFAARSSDDQAKQLKSVVKNYGDVPEVAAVANLRLGDLKMAQGRPMMFSDTAEAQRIIAEAFDFYKSAADLPSVGPAARQEALFALGNAAELLGKPDEAKKRFAQLLSEYPQSSYALQAKARLEGIKSGKSSAFYAKAEKYTRPTTNFTESQVDAVQFEIQNYFQAVPFTSPFTNGLGTTTTPPPNVPIPPATGDFWTS